MLNLDTRQEILGITVFQDTDRENQFYYLPGPPRISHERGQPLFDLFSYRKGGEAGTTTAGGFLNMTVDIGLGALRDRIEQRLKEQYGDEATLAPVPFTKGEVRVIALGEDSRALSAGAEAETAPAGGPLVARGPRFIQSILGAGRPSLDGDNRAIFSFSLSEDGAAFFMGALAGAIDARPVGVVYDLEYVGLLPAYDLEITIDFRSVYDYMRTRFNLATLFFKADVDNIVESLRRNESIKIRETARTLELSTPEATQQRQQRIDQLVKDLASGAMFQPSLTPGQPRVAGETLTATDPAASTPAAAAPSAGAVREGVAPAAAAGIGEALTPRGATGAGGAAPAGTTAAGGAAQPAGTAAPASGAPTTAADVWNALGRPQAAFTFRQISQTEMRTVTYNLTQVSAQKQTVAPQGFVRFLANPTDLNRRVHVVDLNHPFFQRLNINVNASDVDFEAEGVTQMTAQLRYGTRPDGTRPKDTAEVILRRREDSRDFAFFMDKALTQQYEYKLIVDYRNDFGLGVRQTRVESDWISTEARSLSVHPRWLGRTLPVTVQLAPTLPADVAEVHALVRYANPGRGIDDDRLVQLKADRRAERVRVLLAAQTDVVEVTPTLFYADGTQEALASVHLPDPAAGAADDTVVISAPRANRFEMDVIMQDPLAELESVLVDAQVLQTGALADSKSFELTASARRDRWSVRLPRRDAPATLRYRERRLYRDGGLETDEWREAVSPNLVVGIPAEGTMSVVATYIGPAPSAVNLSAIMLDLEYRDPAGDARFAQQKSLLITDDAATHTQEWKVRLPDRHARTYRWKLTLLGADGTETATPVTEDSRDRLILRPRL